MTPKYEMQTKRVTKMKQLRKLVRKLPLQAIMRNEPETLVPLAPYSRVRITAGSKFTGRMLLKTFNDVFCLGEKVQIV
jgi:hypothetical protein